ncbi:biotin synthase BioB, partial [Streptomyces sp. SR27]|nr:biotin synthase BioB [Streptomyces sp. SR27]
PEASEASEAPPVSAAPAAPAANEPRPDLVAVRRRGAGTDLAPNA